MGMIIAPTGGGAGGVDPDELTATANDVLKGKIAGVKGSDEPVTGTMEVQSVLSFSVAPTSATQITCTWKNPAKGPFSGVIIIGKTGSYPTSITDGTRYYKGSGNNTNANGSSTQVISGLSPATKYYFRTFSYAIKNSAEWLAGTSRTAESATPVAKGTQNFTSSGTFTVPDGVTKIDVFCVGGGGGGHKGGKYNSSFSVFAGSGGCGGFTTIKKSISVTPGTKYAVVVGAGGVASTNNSPGGTSSFGSLCSAAGGGTAESYGTPNGGSGGGAGYEGTMSANGGAGGSDGSNGLPPERYGELLGDKDNVYGIGYGQGSTTKAFGESNGALYSGGGGAGVTFVTSDTPFHAGYGGSGGGGRGGQLSSSSENYPASAGSANTGGGGGGSGAWRLINTYTVGGNGGSGIVLVRWGY